MRLIRILLVIIAVVCIGVALSYPIRYRLAQNENNSNMDELAAMRASVQDTDAPSPDASGAPVEEDGGQAPDAGEGTDADMPRQPAASISSTFLPSRAAVTAAPTPPGPAPHTARS